MEGDPVPTIDDPPTEEPELDEDEPDLLDESPFQKIMKLTEDHMLSGWSQLRCYQFVIQFGISRDVFDRMWHDIKASWRMPTMTFAVFCEQRDLNRARLVKVFNLAIKRNQLNTAASAIDKIIKLDGLDQPTRLEVTLNQNSQITNSARDQVHQLMEKMKLLAAPIDDGLGPIVEEAPAESEGTKLKVVRETTVDGYVHKPDKNGVIEIEGRYLPGDPRGRKS